MKIVCSFVGFRLRLGALRSGKQFYRQPGNTYQCFQRLDIYAHALVAVIGVKDGHAATSRDERYGEHFVRLPEFEPVQIIGVIGIGPECAFGRRLET